MLVILQSEYLIHTEIVIGYEWWAFSDFSMAKHHIWKELGFVSINIAVKMQNFEFLESIFTPEEL